MKENNMLLENTSLFLDVDQAISQLAEVTSRYERSDFLMVVLCEDAMPLGNKIARRLGLSLTFTPIGFNVKAAGPVNKAIPAEFDYGMVKESARDTPQDFIFHQEQNFRSDLTSFYNHTYENVCTMHPGQLIILIDHLTNINAEFFQCLTQTAPYQSGSNSFSSPTMRQFAFLHARLGNANKSIHDLDMIIEQPLIEGD